MREMLFETSERHIGSSGYQLNQPMLSEVRKQKRSFLASNVVNGYFLPKLIIK